MNTNAKKILLTGTAFLAVSLAGVGAAHAAVQDLNVGGLTVTAGNADGSNFSADVIADVANGSAMLTGPITNTTNGHGTLNFLGGSVTANGNIGVAGGGPIKAITLGVAGSATTFNQTVNAGTLTFSNSGSATFNGTTAISGAIALGTGSLTIGSGNTVTAGSMTGTGTVNFTNGGALNSAGAMAANSIVNTAGASTIGGAGAATLGAVSVNGGSLAISNIGSSITGAATIGSNTLSFSGSSIGSVAGIGGTLNLNGTATQTIGGAVGTGGAVLATVALTGTGTKTFNGDVHATNLSTNASTVNGTGALAVGTLTNAAGTSTISNAVTATGVTVTAGSLTLSGATSSVSGVTAIGANTLTFGGASLGSVTGSGGTLNLNGAVAQAVSGTVGSAGNELNTLALSGAGTKTFGAEVRAVNLTTNTSTVAGAGALNVGSVTNTAGATTIANSVSTMTVNVQGGSLAFNGGVSGVQTVNMGAVAGNPTTALTGAIGNITNLNHLGGTSTVASATAANTGVSGGGHMTLTAGNLGAVTFGAGGGQVTGAGITSITGNAGFTGTGTVDSQVTAIAVTTTNGGTGTIVVSNAASTLSGASLAANTGLTFTGTAINGAVAGTGANATLTLDGAGNQAVTGAIGGGTALGTVNLNGGGTKTLAGVTATTTNIAAGVTANTNTITGAVNFAGAGATLNIADTHTITGAVTTASGGTLNLLGGAKTLAGAIGTNGARLATVSTANATGTTTFTGGVNADTLTIANGGSVAVNANSAITNAIAVGDGTLTVGNGAIMTADAGLSTSATSAGVILNGAGSTLNANVASSLNGVTKTGGGTSTLGGTGAATIASVSINSGAGTLAITNAGSTITGTSFVGAGNTLDFRGTSMGASTGSGTLDLASGTTTVGSVGTGGQSLAAVNIGTGTKTFGTDLYATNLTFSGAGTANLAATTTANAQAINFNNNAGTVQYGAGVTYTGTAASAGGAAGTLLFGDNATLNGTIGTAPNKIGAVTLGGGANTISQSIFANTINLGTGTVAVGAGLTLGGDVAASAATLNPAGALSVSGNLGRLTAMTLTGNATVTGTAFAADTTNIGIHKLIVNGNSFETAGAATQLNFSVFNNAGGSGQVVANAGGAIVNVVAGTKVNVSVDTADVIVQGQEYVLIDGNEASANTIGATTLTTTNTALLHFKQKLVADGASDGTKNLIVYADRTQISTVTVDPNNGAVGKMLDALGAGGDADVDALQVRLANFGVGQGSLVEQMISTLTPDNSGATMTTTANLGNTTSTIVNNRVGAVRAGGTFGSGESTGNELDGKHFWGQAFGSSADQSKRGFAAGYDAESFGAVFGVDADVMENLRAGIAFAYANTDVSGEDSNRTSTNIDSYQVSLYADMDLSDDYFLSGQLAYMYNDMDTARHNVGGLAGNTARADFHSNQYTARGEVGRSFAVERGLSLTPSALVNYHYIDVADFSEKGAGGLNLRNVKTDEMQILEFGVNLMAEINLDDGHGGFVTPNLHGGYRYDVIGDDVATSAALAGGGTAFKTQGADAAKGTGNIGTGVKWSTASNLDLSVNYDFEGKSDYKAHSGFVRAGYKF